ncbi:MAG: hypothetical protein IJM56_00460, partial [Clostridia bacterium]|nr:hypothetical protein [Clostridia bacterium]
NLKYGVLDDFPIEKSTMTVIQPINMDMYDRTTITIPSGVRAIEGIWLSDSSWTKELILPETLKKNRHICGIRRNIRKKFCS